MIRRLFFIACDTCGAESPGRERTMRDARVAARAAGFRRRNSVDKCGTCVANPPVAAAAALAGQAQP